MPRRDGEVFRLGTAIGVVLLMLGSFEDCRAYRRTGSATLGGNRTASGGANANPQPRMVGGAAFIEASEPAHQGAWHPRAPLPRIGQDGGKRSCLAGVEVARRLAKGVARCRLGAEFAVRSPFDDVEID